jgi:hypothetical protein
MENSIDKIVGGRLSYPKNTTYNVKKDLLENNKVVVGTMFRKTELLDEMENPTLPHPLVVAKQAGFRIVVIDCEHKAFSVAASNPTRGRGYQPICRHRIQRIHDSKCRSIATNTEDC